MALAGYKPGPYRGRAVLVRAKSRGTGFSNDLTLGWRSVALGGVTTYRLRGDHYSMMRRPHVEELAEILSQLIDRLEMTTGEVQPR
jgi:thioesterase domain-containing protein